MLLKAECNKKPDHRRLPGLFVVLHVHRFDSVWVPPLFLYVTSSSQVWFSWVPPLFLYVTSSSQVWFSWVPPLFLYVTSSSVLSTIWVPVLFMQFTRIPIFSSRRTSLVWSRIRVQYRQVQVTCSVAVLSALDTDEFCRRESSIWYTHRHMQRYTDHKSGTVCGPISDYVGCHMTSSGGHCRHFLFGEWGQSAVWTVLTVPNRNILTYLLTYLLTYTQLHTQLHTFNDEVCARWINFITDNW